MRWTLLALVALCVLPGCILSPGQDDLSYVCEAKAGGPGPAYTLDGLVRVTEVGDANLTVEHARRLLAAVQPDVLTLGGHAHADFRATLTPEGGATWRFVAVGRDAAGATLDTYEYLVHEDREVITLEATRPNVEDIPVSESVRGAAVAVVNASPDLADVATRTPTLVATGWSRNIPSCVRLLYQDGPEDAILPAGPEHPHTDVVVSLASHRVVFVKRVGWE